MLPDNPVDKYTWPRPALPKRPIIASSYQDVGMVIVDKETFQSGYDGKIKSITSDVILYKRIVCHLYSQHSPINSYTICSGSEACVL